MHTPGSAATLRTKAQALLQLGDAVSKKKSPAAAESCYRQATQLAPDLPLAWRKLANCQSDLGRVEDQFVSLNQAVYYSNEDPEAIYHLGRRLETSHRLGELDALVQKYGRRFTDDPWILTLEAVNSWRKGNLQEARRIAEHCLSLEPAGTKQFLHWLLGTLFDRLGEYGAAYRNFLRMNAMSEGHVTLVANRLHERVTRLKQYVNDVAPASYQARIDEDAGADDRGPIFVTGFPRSGTTLLGSMLNSHPDLITRDEWGGINSVIKLMGARGRNYPEFIGSLSAAERHEMLEHYRGAQQIEGNSEKHVDKMPLNLVHLELILKLYPRARILVMIRNPYDVCLSCFSQDFRLNAAMQNFVSLERTAQTYAHVMSLAKHHLENASTSIHLVRYEELAADSCKATQSMCAFLGVPWSARILESHEHAKQAPRVHTPSYHQIVQPVHSNSVERWRSYREFLEPLHEWLDPWCGYFHYPLAADPTPHRSALGK